MKQVPADAADTHKIPDFLIRAAVAGDLHPVVIQYLATPAVLAASPDLERDLAAHRGPWLKVSQVLAVDPIRSSRFGHPTLAPLLSSFLGAARAEDFLRFGRSLQRNVPDLDAHLRLLAGFRSFAEAAAEDHAERRPADPKIPPGREQGMGHPPPAQLPQPVPRPLPSARRPSLPSHAMASARPANARPDRAAPVKLWPGHTYVVRRHPARSD